MSPVFFTQSLDARAIPERYLPNPKAVSFVFAKNLRKTSNNTATNTVLKHAVIIYGVIISCIKRFFIDVCLLTVRGSAVSSGIALWVPPIVQPGALEEKRISFPPEKARCFTSFYGKKIRAIFMYSTIFSA